MAMNALHQNLARFKINEKSTQADIKGLIKNAESKASLANFFSFLINLDGVLGYKEISIKLPITRKYQAGKDLCWAINEMVDELCEQLKAPSPTAIEKDHLSKIGHLVIGIENYLPGYLKDMA